MKKNILLIILTFILFFSFSEIATAGKKQYICRYNGSGITASFRLRLDGSKTKAEDAKISGEDVSNDWFSSSNSESVLNWSSSQETGFVGRDYYAKYGNCPPYAYFFDVKGFLGIGGGYHLFVSDQAAGGTFESKLKSKYDIKGKMYVLSLLGPAVEVEPEKLPSSCLDFSEKGDSSATLVEDRYPCEHNPYFACVWNETNANPAGGYCNTDKLQYVKCGDAFDIPAQVPSIISFIINLLKIATPIILVIVSVIALLKALASSKEDEIKKAQQSLIRKIIAAIMVFFVISIVQFVILKVADTSETEGLSSCLTCMINNDCDNSLYYKTNVGGQYFCTGLSGNEIECGETEH